MRGNIESVEGRSDIKSIAMEEANVSFELIKIGNEVRWMTVDWLAHQSTIYQLKLI